MWNIQIVWHHGVLGNYYSFQYVYRHVLIGVWRWKGRLQDWHEPKVAQVTSVPSEAVTAKSKTGGLLPTWRDACDLICTCNIFKLKQTDSLVCPCVSRLHRQSDCYLTWIQAFGVFCWGLLWLNYKRSDISRSRTICWFRRHTGLLRMYIRKTQACNGSEIEWAAAHHCLRVSSPSGKRTRETGSWQDNLPCCMQKGEAGWEGKNEIITHPTLMLGEATESFESEFHAGHLTTTPTATEMHWKDFFSQEACQQEEI